MFQKSQRRLTLKFLFGKIHHFNVDIMRGATQSDGGLGSLGAVQVADLLDGRQLHVQKSRISNSLLFGFFGGLTAATTDRLALFGDPSLFAPLLLDPLALRLLGLLEPGGGVLEDALVAMPGELPDGGGLALVLPGIGFFDLMDVPADMCFGNGK